MRRAITIIGTLAAVAALVTAACGSGSGSSDSFATTGGEQGRGQSTPAVGAPAEEPSADFGFDADFGDDQADFDFEFEEQAQAAVDQAAPLPSTGPSDGGANALQTADRQVIQNASLTIQVEDVRAAAQSAREIATALGGFVEQLSVSGDDDFSQGFVVLRVPQEEFFTAQERLGALGNLLGESVGSQDVTEQFVDLEARLRSLESEEVRLLELLDRADTVSEILIVENELARIRSDIERLTGQRNFLARRVALATITVTFIPPEAVFTEPPSAEYGIDVKDVEDSVEEIKSLVDSLDGVVDRAVLNVRDDQSTASVTIRLHRDDFDSGIASIESLGDVRVKTLREGGERIFPELPDSAVIVDPEEPDARVQISLREDDDGSDTALIASLAGSLGGVAALALIVGAFYWGRRRSRARS